MASRLYEIVEKPEIREEISQKIIPVLEDSCKLYLSESEEQRRKIEGIIDENQLIGRLASKFHNGDFQKAKESLADLELNLGKYLFLYLRKTCSYAFRCVITSPFSREVSKLHYEVYKSCRDATMSLSRALKNSIKDKIVNRKIKRMKNKFLKQKFIRMHDLEIEEAKAFDALVKFGLDEKAASYIATEQPEISFFL